MTASGNDGDGQNTQAATPTVDDDDLFELDISLLARHDDDDGSHLRRRASHCAAAVTDDDGRGHALLANCLLPVSSVSSAVPVAAGAGSIAFTSSSYPYSGYYSPRSRLFTAGSGSKRFRFGRSARFCFSTRGFETMGNYFQRY
jgi:hypothetical protein